MDPNMYNNNNINTTTPINPDTSGMFSSSVSLGENPSSSNLIDKPQALPPNPNLNQIPIQPSPPTPQYPAYSPQVVQNQAVGGVYQPQVQPVVQPMVVPQVNNLNVPLLSGTVNEKTSFDIIEILQDLRDSSQANIKRMFNFSCCNEGCLVQFPWYDVSIVNRRDQVERLILKCKIIFDQCKNAPMEMRMKYIPRDTSQNYITINNYEVRLFDFKGFNGYRNDSSCCGQKPTSTLYYAYNQQLLGEIYQPLKCRCCCTDPIYEIKSNSGLKRYVTTTDGSQCSYCCCRGCCCKENSVSFPIYNQLCSQIVGEIFKDTTPRPGGFVLSGDKTQQKWRVNFPLDAFPEDKLLLIANAILIDFQEY